MKYKHDSVTETAVFLLPNRRTKVKRSSLLLTVTLRFCMIGLLYRCCMISIVITSAFTARKTFMKTGLRSISITNRRLLHYQQQQRQLLLLTTRNDCNPNLHCYRTLSCSTRLSQQQQQQQPTFLSFRHKMTTTTTTRLFYQQNVYTSCNNEEVPVVSSTGGSDNDNNVSNNKVLIIKTNRELAEERIQKYRQKREAREKSIAIANQRNYELKQLLHGDDSTTTTITTRTELSSGHTLSSMYQVKILVCDTLRKELKLSGREKRGRVFISFDSNATQSMQQLQYEMHAFFRALKKDSYLLYGGYPLLSSDGKIIASISNVTSNNNGVILSSTTATTSSSTNTDTIWPIQTDEDVQLTFQRANDWFESQTVSTNVSTSSTSTTTTPRLVRPSIVIHVKKNPNMKPPPPPPEYLINMPNPIESTHISMLSFYAFPVNGITDPNEYAVTLRKLFKPFHALGRIYIAHEGINAQMSVPTNVLFHFQSCCNTLPNGVGTYLQQNGGINIDPIPLTRDEYAVAGIQAAAATSVPFVVPTTTNTTTNPSNDTYSNSASEQQQQIPLSITQTTPTVPTPPFSNLHIRVRQQIVTDGLTKSLDWQQAGYDMPPLEWHAKLKEEIERRKNGNDTNGTRIRLLDCRNLYETDVGRFETAEPLETNTFRDSWDALKERLADTPKDAPIMTYCTGGIRCVKVGAYLTQELGFTNVSRLAGGIIAYDRTLNEQIPDEKPLFKGTNFVFDGRLGRPITEDTLASCLTCGSETSAVSNCRNGNCHRRIVQCETCRTSLLGTCSDACRNRLVNGAMRYRRNSSSDSSTDSSVSSNSKSNDQNSKQIFSNIEEYVHGHSSPVPSIYPEIEMNTRILIPSGSHMVSGNVQGKLLTQFASMTWEGRILELGTFTGYGTTCLLEGAGLVGRTNQNNNSAVGSRECGPYVLTMERDAKAYDVAVSQLSIVCKHGINEEAAEVLCGLRGEQHHKLLITNVSDTASTAFIYDNVATCELLKVSDGLAIVEEMAAGLGSLQQVAPFDLVYLDADKTRLLEYTDALLSSDRVLKKGGMIVVDNVLWKGLVVEANNGVFTSLTPADDVDSEEEELRKNRRARKLASKMHRFNSEIVKDPRVHVQVLPIRDGLSLIRKL